MIKRIILCGPGASGKDHFRNRLVETKGLIPDISYTTRPMRDGEVDNVDYHYISEETMGDMLEHEEMLECVQFNNNWYGTSKWSWNKSEVFIMTAEGFGQISKEDRSDSLVYYFNPSKSTRHDRMREGRGMSVVEAMDRIEADSKEFRDFTDYDIMITNPDF